MFHLGSKKLELWELAGGMIALLLITATALNSVMPFSSALHRSFFSLVLETEFCVGFYYSWSGDCTVMSSALAAAKTAFLGLAPEAALAIAGSMGLFHITVLKNDGTADQATRGIVDFCTRTDATISPIYILLAVPISIAGALVVGLIGALLARFASRRSPQTA